MEKAAKQEVIKAHQINKDDNGSADVQVALLSARIKELAEHMIEHPKDLHSRRGLLMMLSERKKLLKYLLRTEPARHAELIKKVGLRK